MIFSFAKIVLSAKCYVLSKGVVKQHFPKFFTLHSSLFTKKSVALQRNPKPFTIHHSPFIFSSEPLR